MSPPRVSHRFLLTSVTKVLTAAQVMALVEAGLLTLETPITEVIPEFEAGGKRDVTVAHVLTHTSGVGRRTSDTAERLMPALVRADHVQQAIRARASWPPGTRVEYSSALFWALGEVIDRLTGGSSVDGLGVWLRARAGADVGYATDKVPDDYVIPTSAEAAALAERTRRIAFPAGGAIGSVEDVLRFDAQFLTRAAETVPHLLDHDSVGAMSRSWTTGLPGRREPDHAGPGTERAVGWALGGPGRFRPDHDALARRGLGASVWVDRAAGIVVAFLSAQWFLPRAFYRDTRTRCSRRSRHDSRRRRRDRLVWERTHSA